jgi:hypothetical protein
MPLATDTQAAAAQETSDGTLVGRNADSKVGFYGTAPITRPILPTTAAAAQIAEVLAALGLTRLT